MKLFTLKNSDKINLSNQEASAGSTIEGGWLFILILSVWQGLKKVLQFLSNIICGKDPDDFFKDGIRYVAIVFIYFILVFWIIMAIGVHYRLLELERSTQILTSKN